MEDCPGSWNNLLFTSFSGVFNSALSFWEWLPQSLIPRMRLPGICFQEFINFDLLLLADLSSVIITPLPVTAIPGIHH